MTLIHAPAHAAPAADGVAALRPAAFALADPSAPPATGWRPAEGRLIFPYGSLPGPDGAVHGLWVTAQFERGASATTPLALLTDGSRDRMRVFLNGSEIYRDFASPQDRTAQWYAPVLIPLPADRLQPGTNQLMISVASRYDLAVGSFEVGPQAALAPAYGERYLWRIDLPRKVNFAMLMLAYAAVVYWGLTRREARFGILGVTFFFWFIGSYSYLFEDAPVGEIAYWRVPLYFFVLAAAGTLLFTAKLVDVRRLRWVIAAIVAAGALVIGLGVAAPTGHALDIGARLASAALVAFAAGLALAAWRRSRSWEHLAIGLVLALLVAAGVHDFGRLWFVGAWDGLGLYLQPYEGFVLAIVCLGSFGGRAAGAFASLRRLNAELEARVVAALRDLAASEAARRELEVAHAIKSERERLLREIHDGIGSNLVTALRVAEQQNQPRTTIRTLRRALADLKITVDSLEPVEGDLVALIGNLRHRMEPELREAGLKSRWKVTECRLLPWLDATNALHVLRIIQEAVGNVLAHAGADEIELGCFEEGREGAPGLTAYVADNGIGLDPQRSGAGRGMANMRARARALHGELDCAPRPGGGVRVTLWLPLARAEALPTPP